MPTRGEDRGCLPWKTLLAALLCITREETGCQQLQGSEDSSGGPGNGGRKWRQADWFNLRRTFLQLSTVCSSGGSLVYEWIQRDT